MDNIFKKYGISTIIAIDDDFNEFDENKELSKFQPEVIDQLTNSERDRYLDHTIKEYIEETGDIEFSQKLRQTLLDKNYYSWLQFEGFRPIGVDTEVIKQSIADIDTTDKSRKHLIVLDRRLEETGDERFKEILKIVKKFLKEKNLLLLIYTNENIPDGFHNFSGVKEYLQTRLDFAPEEAEELALHFNYVSKTEKISNEFFDNILKSQKANYIQAYKQIFEESYRKLTERLWELNKNQALFYYDYINEGQHADDIIYDIFLTKFHQVYGEIFGEDAQHAELANPIRRSMQRHLSGLSNSVVDSYREDKEKIVDSSLNLLKIPASSDLSFGDVIKIGEKYFMLLNQDCDIVIRNKGKRKLNYFQLVELSTQSGFEPFPKNLYSINCIWLDSLSLRKDSDGIKLSKDSIEASHEIRVASSDYLKDKLNEILEKLKGNSEETIKAIIDFSLSSLAIECNPIFEDENLTGFHLKNINRIGRLERLSAMKVLKEVQFDGSRIPDSQSILI
ncbi:TPA: hypothetical protein ACHU5P_001392 [Streptococcus suis]